MSIFNGAIQQADGRTDSRMSHPAQLTATTASLAKIAATAEQQTTTIAIMTTFVNSEMDSRELLADAVSAEILSAERVLVPANMMNLSSCNGYISSAIDATITSAERSVVAWRIRRSNMQRAPEDGTN